MSKISKSVKNHHDVTVTWPFPSIWNVIAVIKIKSDVINEDFRSLWCYMWSVIEILCGLEEKIGPVCMQLQFLNPTLLLTSFIFFQTE